MKTSTKIKEFYAEMKPEYTPVFGFIGIFVGLILLGSIIGASVENTVRIIVILWFWYGIYLFRKYREKKKKK